MFKNAIGGVFLEIESTTVYFKRFKDLKDFISKKQLQVINNIQYVHMCNLSKLCNRIWVPIKLYASWDEPN